jgi:hypothetical protein
MPRQAALFDVPSKPRRVLMHANDAGDTGTSAGIVGHFECKRCGHKAGWLLATKAEIRSGVPCPQCNPS